jgi:hypothetical protein
MTSCNNRGILEGVFFGEAVPAVKQWQLVLKVNRSYGVGRRATSKDTVRRLGKYYSEL